MLISLKSKIVVFIMISILSLVIVDAIINHHSLFYSYVIKLSLLLVILIASNYFVQWLIIDPLKKLSNVVNELKNSLSTNKSSNTTQQFDMDFITMELTNVVSLLKSKGEEFKKQSELFESILKEIESSIIVIDKEMRIIFCNPMSERLFGFNKNEIIGKNVMELYLSESVSKDELNNAFDEANKKGKYTYTLKRIVDNKSIHLESTLYPKRDSNEEISGYYLITNYISEAGRHQTRLYLQYKISRILVESTNLQDALKDVLRVICDTMRWDCGEIVIIDNQSNYLKYDIRWGLDSSFELIKRSEYYDFKYESGFISSDQMKGVIFNIEGRHHNKKGLMTFVGKNIFNYDDELKQTLQTISKIIGVFIERQEAEEKDKLYTDLLMKKNKELEEFAYVASHDLQQPLRVITGFAQLLESRFAENMGSEGKEMIGYISQSVKKMQDLIDDLLSYSRVSTNVRSFAFVNLKDIIENAISNLQSLIAQTGATIKVDNFSEMPDIYCDHIQISQVFQNLIDNAIKYRQKDIPPVIEISTMKRDDIITIAVQDNGIGFDISQVERVFKIFQRLHSDDQYPGTGIGLSICKKIIERHQGIIWVESEEGKGTTFYISLNIYPKK